MRETEPGKKKRKSHHPATRIKSHTEGGLSHNKRSAKDGERKRPAQRLKEKKKRMSGGITKDRAGRGEESNRMLRERKKSDRHCEQSPPSVWKKSSTSLSEEKIEAVEVRNKVFPANLIERGGEKGVRFAEQKKVGVLGRFMSMKETQIPRKRPI